MYKAAEDTEGQAERRRVNQPEQTVERAELDAALMWAAETRRTGSPVTGHSFGKSLTRISTEGGTTGQRENSTGLSRPQADSCEL